MFYVEKIFCECLYFMIYAWSMIQMFIIKFLKRDANYIIYVKDCIEYRCPLDECDFTIHISNEKRSLNAGSFEETNAKFIFTEIVFGSNKIKIQFKTDKYNYYLVGNVFDRVFIRYFMKQHYNSDVDDYTIIVIDNDVNRQTFTDMDRVVFYKDQYVKVALK